MQESNQTTFHRIVPFKCTKCCVSAVRKVHATNGIKTSEYKSTGRAIKARIVHEWNYRPGCEFRILIEALANLVRAHVAVFLITVQ